MSKKTAAEQAIVERVLIEKDVREDMILALQAYMREEFDREIGHLAAELMLRFVIGEIGPTFYNAGVRDAARFMLMRLEDIAEIELS